MQYLPSISLRSVTNFYVQIPKTEDSTVDISTCALQQGVVLKDSYILILELSAPEYTIFLEHDLSAM